MVNNHISQLEFEAISRWENIAEWWTKRIKKGGDVFRTRVITPSILQLTDSIAKKNVLDAGCGDGYLSRILSELGAQVIGVDASYKMIEYANEFEENHQSRIKYKVSPLRSLNWIEDHKFDLVISNMVIMDIPDLNSILSELYRVLKLNGTLIFSILHPGSVCASSPWLESLEGQSYNDMAHSSIQNDESIFKIRIHPEAPIRTLYFHRPIEYYLKLLQNLKFEISSQNTPLIRQELLSDFPNADTLTKYPLFWILKAKRLN